MYAKKVLNRGRNDNSQKKKKNRIDKQAERENYLLPFNCSDNDDSIIVDIDVKNKANQL
jgi:hypothetical protein